jgi:CheY-like chemotaxis protein
MAKAAHFLLVEDDATDVALIQTALDRSGPCEISVANDGQEAIDFLVGKLTDANATAPAPQLILLDLKMPRLTGFEFLDWLRHRAPDPLRLLPVIIMSSSDEPEDVNRAYALGANCYVAKCTDWSRFRERILTVKTLWTDLAERPTA